MDLLVEVQTSRREQITGVPPIS